MAVHGVLEVETGGFLEFTAQPALPTWQVPLTQKQDGWYLKNNIQSCPLTLRTYARTPTCIHVHEHTAHSVSITFLLHSRLDCS